RSSARSGRPSPRPRTAPKDAPRSARAGRRSAAGGSGMAWRQAAIAGIGASRQGKLPGETALSLATEAFKSALADADMKKEEFDGLLTMPGTSSPEGAKHYLALGERLGIDPTFTGSLSMGGATAGALVQIAAMAVSTGMA